MENLKIKVNNEVESGEAQALLLKMGYKLERLNKYEYPQYVAFNPADMMFKNYVMDAYVPLLWKEITLSALRDMLEPQHKENLRIKVNNEAESKETQELFFKLGYGFEGCKIKSVLIFEYTYPFYFFSYRDMDLTVSGDNSVFSLKAEHKETTLPELRDKVVLKRNDVSDATHTDQDGWKWYIGADSYVWQAGNAQQLKQWDKSELKHVDLKPIQESTMTTPQHKENLKIHVKNEAESKEAQELFFKLGREWFGGSKSIIKTLPWIYCGGSLLSHCSNAYNLDHGFNLKEITLQELRNMLEPQHKEYLDPQNNYELIEWDGGFMVQDHWIEVPMGAESYMMTSAHAQRGIFYKKGWYEFLEAYERSNWKQTGYSNKNYKSEMLEKGCALVWQRDAQPNQTTIDAMNADVDSEVHSSTDELFASVLGTTAWDTQVGGNHYKQFKIQPMQFALENNLDAAQHNVIKYVMRHASKNGKEDLEKAKHYIDLMIQHYYGAQ